MIEKLIFIRNKVCIFFLCVIGMITVTSCASQEASLLQGEENSSFWIDITFEGGSGKAYIKSPVEVTDNNGKLTAKFVWSSENYDYMIVDGKKYDNENKGGESTFTVDIENVSEPLTVIGDTVAMSTPHEIEYVITWGEKKEDEEEDEGNLISTIETNKESVREALLKSGLEKTGDISLKYANRFFIEEYGDYYYISIENSGDYLLVPEVKEAPANLPKDTVVIKRPVSNAYLVSTAAFDLVNTCGALGDVRFLGAKESDLYIEEVKKAMQEGKILYAGKYRAPDYELLLQEECDMVIENTMIFHEPSAMAKLKELGMPVLVETSSYEKHPLGRLEWIKLYGILFDKEKEAEDFFNKQLQIMEPLMQEKTDTGKTVAFFHVTSNGNVNVRKSGDYITKMIELSGGRYALTNAGEGENALSTMNMQMEDFYTNAVDADIIIYNSTIGGEISSIDELISLNPLFADFKAVKEKNVYCTRRNLFQQITGMADFMQDLNNIFFDIESDYTYLNKLE